MAALISLDDLKEFLPIRAGLNTFDAKLTTIIDAVSKHILGEIRRDLTRKTYTQVFDTRPTRSIGYDFAGSSEDGLTVRSREQVFSLKGLGLDTGGPVQVFYDPYRVWGAETAVSTSDFYADADNDRIVLSVGTNEHLQALKVVYTAGYEEVDGVYQNLPPDLKLAATMQSLHLYNRMNPNAISVSQDAVDGYKIGSPLVVKGGLLPDVLALLMQYRRVNMRG